MKRKFEFIIIIRLGPIAQLAEHGTENAGVGGSIPPWATICDSGLILGIEPFFF